MNGYQSRLQGFTRPTCQFLDDTWGATQFPADQQRPGSLNPINIPDLQDQEILQIDASVLRQCFRPDFNERFEHLLNIKITETGTPPDLRDGLVLIERHLHAPF